MTTFICSVCKPMRLKMRQFNGEIEWQVITLATKPEFDLLEPIWLMEVSEAFKLSCDHHICVLVSPLSLNTH